MTEAWSTRWLLLPIAALAVLTLAACSGSGESAEPEDEAAPPQETATPTTAPRVGGQGPGGAAGGGFTQLDDAELDALLACLADEGIEVPEGATDLQALFGGGPPDADLQAALEACATETGVTLFGNGRGDGPAGGRFGGDGGNAEALIECLNEEGLDTEALAAPDEGGPGPGGLLAGLDRDDPEVQAALAVCAPDLGTGGRR